MALAAMCSVIVCVSVIWSRWRRLKNSDGESIDQIERPHSLRTRVWSEPVIPSENGSIRRWRMHIRSFAASRKKNSMRYFWTCSVAPRSLSMQDFKVSNGLHQGNAVLWALRWMSNVLSDVLWTTEFTTVNDDDYSHMRVCHWSEMQWNISDHRRSVSFAINIRFSDR